MRFTVQKTSVIERGNELELCIEITINIITRTNREPIQSWMRKLRSRKLLLHIVPHNKQPNIQFGLMLFRILWNKLFFSRFYSPQFQRLPFNFRVWLLHHTEKYTAYVCVCLLIKIKARTLNRLISHRHKWNYSKWLIFSWCTFDLFASLSHSVCIL